MITYRIRDQIKISSFFSFYFRLKCCIDACYSNKNINILYSVDVLFK